MYKLNRKYKLFLLLVKDTSSKYYWQKYRLHALQKKLSSSSHVSEPLPNLTLVVSLNLGL